MQERFSRRDFLEVAGKSAIALAGIPIIEAVDPTDSEVYSVETIDGVTVFGGESPITSRSQIEAIVNPPERRRFERKFMPKNLRYWEFFVPKSTYDKFEQNEISVDFTTWANFQVEKTNEMLTQAKPEIPIRIKLKRILVLDDSLYPNHAPFWKPEHDNDNFSRWASDVDSRWAFGPDYYDYLFGEDKIIGELNPGRSGRRVIVGTYAEVFEGKNAKMETVDWGLIHELIHHLDVGDLYWPPPELPRGQFGHLPYRYRKFAFFPNDIMGSPTNRYISPLTAYAINLRASESHRGVQHDGVADGSTVENPYLRFPEKAEIGFEGSSELFERLGEEVVKIEKVSVLTDAEKVYEIDSSYQNGNEIKIAIEATSKNYWYLVIEGKHQDKKFALPFPRFIFNLNAWQGVEEPKYKINLTGNDSEYSLGLSVKTVHRDVFNPEDGQLFAWTKIPATEAYLIWEWTY